jgi:hypothetical protein
MNSPEKNNYIQYVNELGKVQTKPVQFVNDGENTRFIVQGIKESFFILGVYQNNIQVYGVGFDDIENNDMLAFINSNIIDLDCIPTNAFLNSEQVVTMSYNNDYVKNFQKPEAVPQQNPSGSESGSQKTNERLYFEEYLKNQYPSKTFQIVPFAQTLKWNIDVNYTHLYYIKHSKSAQPVQLFASPKLPFHLQSEGVYNIVNSLKKSDIVNVEGYKAVADSPLWIPDLFVSLSAIYNGDSFLYTSNQEGHYVISVYDKLNSLEGYELFNGVYQTQQNEGSQEPSQKVMLTDFIYKNEIENGDRWAWEFRNITTQETYYFYDSYGGPIPFD